VTELAPERVRITPRLVAACGAAWLLLATLSASQDYVISRYVGRPMSWARAFRGIAPHYVFWAMLAVPILLLAGRFPLERRKLLTRIPLHIALSVAFFLTDGVLSTIVIPHVIGDPRLTPQIMRIVVMQGFYDDFLLYWAFVALRHLFGYHRELLGEQWRRSELMRELTAAKLSALRAQLQPHFLFNTLNSIAELMHHDVAAAEEMTESLSELLRATLASDDAQEIALREEVGILEIYLRIQQVRFSDSITIERSFPAAAMDALVPTFLLQPLVENAFRHGIARRKHGRVRVCAERVNGEVRIDVEDNGVGLPAAGLREGIGLKNTRVRLERLYGAAQSLTIAPIDGGGTRVRITLPFRSVIEGAVSR
jgi:signal transduction histidine kinase